MKNRYLLFVFVSFINGACAVAPKIWDLDLKHQVDQDRFLRETDLKARLSDDALTVALGQKNGQVVLGHIENFGHNYREEFVHHQFSFSIKAIASDPSENRFFVSDTQWRGFGDRLIEPSLLPEDPSHRGSVCLSDGRTGSVILGRSVNFYVSALASLGNNVAFEGHGDLVSIRDVTNHNDTCHIDIHQFGHINSIDFYNENSIFCVFDNNLLLYDISTGAILFNLSPEDLGLRRASRFSNAIFKNDLLFTVAGGAVCAYRSDDHTHSFAEIGVLHKNVPSELKLRLCKNKNVLLGYGCQQLLVNQDNYSHDVVYVWPNVPARDCITLNFDQRIFVMDAVITDRNEIVAVVAVNNNLRIVTISFKGRVSSFVEKVERMEIGERPCYGGKNVLPRGNKSFNVEFDDTVNTFFISEPAAPASSAFDQDSDDDDCPPRRKPVAREWGQGTVGEDGSELCEDR